MHIRRLAAVAAFTLATTGVLHPVIHLPEPVARAADAQLSGDLAKAIRAGDLDIGGSSTTPTIYFLRF